MGGLLRLLQRGRAWASYGPAQSPPGCTKCESPAYPSTASVPLQLDIFFDVALFAKGYVSKLLLLLIGIT